MTTLLEPGAMVQHSTNRAVRYRAVDFLGAGGFGQAYLAEVLVDGSRDPVGTTCLKVTDDPDTWHGEAYFMGLLRDQSHVVVMNDAFPALVGEGQAARMLFCIDMELVRRGSVADMFESGEKPWDEGRVARQIRLLLQPLGLLHHLNTPHRDITPYNVFVGDRGQLLLGDYGIAHPSFLKSGTLADTFNPAFVPRTLGKFWDNSDDIYQVGLLAITLLAGEVQTNTVKKPDVNQLTSRGEVRDIIKNAISVKSERYHDAHEMAEALGTASSRISRE